MGRQKIRQLTLSAWSILLSAILLMTLFIAWVTYRFLQPFPPKTLTMVTGFVGGSYQAFGERYRQVLAQEGIRVELRRTSGAVENLRMLKDRSQQVDAGFVQGTIGAIEESSNLVSLGSLAYTPLWIFYRGNDSYDDLSQLQGKRIAIGPEGSGIRKFSLGLLKAAGVTDPPTVFSDLSFDEAQEALRQGRLDVIMTFSAVENPMIWDCLKSMNWKILSLSQAEAYTRRFQDLSHVVLPRGVIDPGRRNPPVDIHLLSPTTNLIIRKELHPALVYLLLKSSVEIHSGAGLVNKAGEFPSLSKQDDPISDQAQRYYKSGGSWVYAYLPFWAAALVERLTLLLIPLGVIILPLIGIAPWIYTWRNRSRYYPWYRELMKLEKEILENKPVDKISEYKARLDQIEEAVSRLHTSVAFYDELFILKGHVQNVRSKLEALAPTNSCAESISRG
jgi:TRAP transporter TAXI family solute receptor